MMLAVDPGLKGLLVVSPPGTGKSLLAAAFRSILPESEPGSTWLVGGGIPGFSACGQDSAHRSDTACPFIEVPIGVTEDMLVGGIDIAATLAEGSRRVSKGLLARANGGFICVDHINLLDSVNLRHLTVTLDSGFVTIEKDGISASHQARFSLIGAMDSWDGEASDALTDRVGLIVEDREAPSESERADIVHRAEQFERDPRGFCSEFATETTQLRRKVLEARSLLTHVRMARSDIARLSRTALDLGIHSSRADLFAVRAVKASAALRGDSQVSEADLVTAVEYVLRPRAAAGVERQPVTSQAPPLVGGADDRLSDRQEPASPGRGKEQGQQDKIGELDEVIKEPQDCPVPGELKETGVALRGSLGKVRAKSGRRAEQTGAAHGRYVGAARPIGGLRLGNRIAIDATLRAAAPYQRARRAAADSKCEGIREEVGGQRPGSKGRMAKSPENKRRVIIDPADLRIKKLKHRSGVLFIFLVDTSGSMALGRIGHAKGVMIRMLREAYLHRDSVALIAFRGTTVQVVLEPTSSVELARRAIESMPAGGGTPLAAGLSGAIALAERARKRTAGKTALLVFTDGRVNVPLKPLESSGKSDRDAGIRAELEAMGRQLQDHGIGSVVIDTGSWEAKGGRCASIAEALGARYCRLPGSGPDGLYREIRNFTDESRVP